MGDYELQEFQGETTAQEQVNSPTTCGVDHYVACLKQEQSVSCNFHG